MVSLMDWKVPAAAQPKPENYRYDLDHALTAVVGVRAVIPADAFTAETLGTERFGNGVLISPDGLVLTIGYLITEAETVWLSLIDGRAVPGHVLGYDQATGFGLLQALARLDLPALSLGDSSAAQIGDPMVVAGAGGRQRSVAARLIGRQEFAGYWEYVLDEALFTAPAHPHWGGTALIGPAGDLIGIGSLPIAVVTLAFSGMVLAYHTAHLAATYGFGSVVGYGVAESVCRELGGRAARPIGRRGRGSACTPRKSTTRW